MSDSRTNGSETLSTLANMPCAAGTDASTSTAVCLCLLLFLSCSAADTGHLPGEGARRLFSFFGILKARNWGLHEAEAMRESRLSSIMSMLPTAVTSHQSYSEDPRQAV